MDEAKRILEERGAPEQIRVCQWLWDGSFESEEQLKEYYWAMGPLYSIRFDSEKFESSWARGIRNFEQLNLGFRGFLRTFDFVDELRKISCPTLVLAGAHDWICPPAQARVIADSIPRAHLKVFPHSAHSIAGRRARGFPGGGDWLPYLCCELIWPGCRSKATPSGQGIRNQVVGG